MLVFRFYVRMPRSFTEINRTTEQEDDHLHEQIEVPDILFCLNLNVFSPQTINETSRFLLTFFL